MSRPARRTGGGLGATTMRTKRTEESGCSWRFWANRVERGLCTSRSTVRHLAGHRSSGPLGLHPRPL